MMYATFSQMIQMKEKTIKHTEQTVNRRLPVKGRQQGVFCTVLETFSVGLKLFLSKRLKEIKY